MLKSIIIIALISILPMNAFASTLSSDSVKSDQSKKQILFVDGVSERLIEKDDKKNELIRLVQVGVYKDYLFPQTRKNFTALFPGFFVNFQHKLWSIWQGSLEARWSHWKTKDGDFKYLMPLGFYSKIAVKPHIECSGVTLAPYLTLGVGYTIPFEGDSYFQLHVPKAFGELSAIGGGGLDIILLKSFGINASFDTWKSLETDQYFVGMFSFGLIAQF